MANNNIQNVRFLRNGTLFTSREEAKSTLTNFTLTPEMDGSSILARYQVGTDHIKTLVGYVYYKDKSNNSVTIFDIDDAGSDVDEKIRTAIEALDAEIPSSGGKNVQVKVTETDGKITAVNITTDNTVNSDDVANAIKTEIDKLEYSDTAVDGQYVSQVSETDGKIAVVRVDLPSLTEVKETGKPIVAVSENKGQVAARAGNINAEFVDIADSGQKFTAKTVEGALAEIATEIDAMDLAVVSGNGEVITAVSEEDGKVSASKTAIKDVKLTGYAKNTTATGAISETDDIEDALSKLENKIGSNAITNADGSITVTPANGSTTDVKVHINSGEKVISLGNDGIYTDIKLSAVTVSEANVKEAFALIASDGATQLGSTIKIYKDSSLLSVALLHADYSDPQNPVLPRYDKINGWTDIASPTQANQALCFAYENIEGNVVVAAVPVGSFINEQEFASGLTWDSTAGKVIGVVDPSSESFLTVGTNGFKVDGIKGEIDTKINALDATVGSQTVASGKHVAVEVVENAGKLTSLTVTETDIASAQGLADEITARGNADTELSNRLGANVTTTNTASAQLSALSGTSEDASGVTSVNGAKKYAQQYADEKVAAVVGGLDATVSGETADGKVNVKVTEADGVITAVNVVGTDIASDSALTAEIEARKAVDGQTGQTYAANANANYIGKATSLNDADIKLDIALKALDDDVIKSVKVNGVALGKTSNAVNVQISSTPASGTSASPIIVNTDNTTGAVTLQILQIDCGEY